MTSSNASLAALAASQHGAFTTEQARRAGFTPKQITRRVQAGTWVRAARGVLLIAGSPATWHQRAIVALLARPDAVLGHLAAGHAHGLVSAPLARPTLIVPPGTSARATGASGVRRLVLHPDDVVLVDGLRCTSPARTLVDLAGVLPSPALQRAADDLLHAGRTSLVQLDLALERAVHLTQVERASVQGAVEAWRDIRPGSAAEVRLLRLVEAWGLPAPERQVAIRSLDGEVVGRVDLGWPALRFGVEYDGEAHHGPNRWAADEARHRAIDAAGWTILRVGARDLLPSSDLRTRLVRQLERAAGAVPAS